MDTAELMVGPATTMPVIAIFPVAAGVDDELGAPGPLLFDDTPPAVDPSLSDEPPPHALSIIANDVAMQVLVKLLVIYSLPQVKSDVTEQYAPYGFCC